MSSFTRLRPRILCGVVLVFLGVFIVLTTSVSPRVGVTYDELGHITTGYAYWKFADYRVNAENGILATRASGVPLLAMSLQFPTRDSDFWKNCNARALGQEFFYYTGNDFRGILWRARLGTLFFGVGCLWLIWQWARRLFGAPGGLVALTFATLSPTFLAHAGLATSDLILTFCLVAALGAWWRFWHVVSWPRLLLAGFTAGLAFTAKMSGVLLVPMLGVLLLVRLLRPAPLIVSLGISRRWLRSRYAQGLALAFASVAAAAISVGVIWACYGFRYSAAPEGPTTGLNFITSWSELLSAPPPTRQDSSSIDVSRTDSTSFMSRLPRRVIGWARDHRVLPEAFVWGAGYTYHRLPARESFLNGSISRSGWKLFFPLAFLMKTTPAELAAFVLGVLVLALTWRRRGNTPRRSRRWLYRSAPLLVLFVIYWAVALSTPLQIGHRHLLPIYPVIFVFCGATVLGMKMIWKPAGAVVLLALGTWQAWDSMAARPFYLSYFTPLVGGTNQGWRHLVDSSLDWGQGLPDLELWLKSKETSGDTAPVYLTYFGSDSPRARKLPVIRLADFRDDHGARHYPQIIGGWYIISATYYQKVYLDIAGPWSDKLEGEYADCMRALQVDAATAAHFTPQDRARLLAIASRHELLFFGRLRHYLGDLPPRAIVGASLLVFKLSDAEIQAVLNAPLSELNARRSSRRGGG